MIYWQISFEKYVPNHLISLLYNFYFSFTDLWKVLYVSNESERSFPQHCILSLTTLHSRSLPLNDAQNFKFPGFWYSQLWLVEFYTLFNIKTRLIRVVSRYIRVLIDIHQVSSSVYWQNISYLREVCWECLCSSPKFGRIRFICFDPPTESMSRSMLI